MRQWLSSAFVVFVSCTAFAQTIPADLQKVVEARNDALRTGDEQAWARYTTDDYIVISTDGTVRTKAQRMAEIKGTKSTTPKLLDRKYRAYGDTVIESVTEQNAEGTNRLSVVWVKQNGQWKVASVHQTRVAKP
jgi:ketosteroid isomerase-like protein